MDSNRRYGWRNHNYVFDNNTRKYVLQHRSKPTTIDTKTSTIYHHTSINKRNNNNNNTSTYKNITGQEPRSIDSRYFHKLQSKYGERKNSQINTKQADMKNKKRSKFLKKSAPISKTPNLSPRNDRDLQSRDSKSTPKLVLSLTIPNNDNPQYVLLNQSNIKLIVTNWYRIHNKRYLSQSKPNSLNHQFIISVLMAYSIQRYEFDEHHPLIQTWIDYDIEDDDVSSVDSHDTDNHLKSPCISQSKSIPIHLMRSTTSASSEDEACNSDSSLSISNDSIPPLLSPSVSASSPYSLGYHKKKTGLYPHYNSQKMRNMSKYDSNWQCSASLDQVKWSTIFLGSILHSTLLHKQLYVVNVSIDKLGYGLGFAFFGHHGQNDEDDEVMFYDEPKLNQLIQNKYNGYPDLMKDCFVLYDDGEFCQWDVQNTMNKKGNVNHLLNSSVDHTSNVKLTSKLSKFQLKTRKINKPLLPSTSISPTSTSSSSSSSSSAVTPNEEHTFEHIARPKKKILIRSKSKKGFYSNPKKKRSNITNSERGLNAEDVRTVTLNKKSSFYTNRKSKIYKSNKNKVNEKFSFDEQDIIQISVDLYHKRISVHNLNNHKCVVIKDFNYDSIRIAFALRFSTITIIDQKWL